MKKGREIEFLPTGSNKTIQYLVKAKGIGEEIEKMKRIYDGKRKGRGGWRNGRKRRSFGYRKRSTRVKGKISLNRRQRGEEEKGCRKGR